MANIKEIEHGLARVQKVLRDIDEKTMNQKKEIYENCIGFMSNLVRSVGSMIPSKLNRKFKKYTDNKSRTILTVVESNDDAFITAKCKAVLEDIIKLEKPLRRMRG